MSIAEAAAAAADVVGFVAVGTEYAVAANLTSPIENTAANPAVMAVGETETWPKYAGAEISSGMIVHWSKMLQDLWSE